MVLRIDGEMAKPIHLHRSVGEIVRSADGVIIIPDGAGVIAPPKEPRHMPHFRSHGVHGLANETLQNSLLLLLLLLQLLSLRLPVFA